MPAVHSEPSWWTTLYDDVVADLFLARPGHEAAEVSDFLWRWLELSPGAAVFDQCCGTGGLAVPLSQRGARVHGVDAIPGYVARARAAAQAAGAECTFTAGDARDHVPELPCDAAFNWGTGFGNDDDDGNRRMLAAAFSALRPGGRFVLDYQNIAGVLARFQPVLLRRGQARGGEVLLVRESELALDRGLLIQRWTCVLPDGTRWQRHSQVRLYLPDALTELLHACGYSEIDFLGDVDGTPLTLASPRCLCRARRPRP